MHQSLFFKLFPPPKYMAAGFAGLEISDEAIRCLMYRMTLHGRVISKFDQVKLPTGVIEGGEVKNAEVLAETLGSFVKKNSLSYVNVSVPEEKAYLFQTDVTGDSIRDIAQNIEFKLEENVPLSAKDAVFYFDLMPLEATGGISRASVSVAQRTYIEKQINYLQSFGLLPIAFELVPKSIARTALENTSNKTVLVVHLMGKKTGIYIVSNGVVCFTSTTNSTDSAVIREEMNNTYEYWKSKDGSLINEAVVVGRGALEFEMTLPGSIIGGKCRVSVANTWRNAFDLDQYVPPLSRVESLDYVVVAGLGLDS